MANPLKYLSISTVNKKPSSSSLLPPTEVSGLLFASGCISPTLHPREPGSLFFLILYIPLPLMSPNLPFLGLRKPGVHELVKEG
jgi:hypothetical protein